MFDELINIFELSEEELREIFKDSPKKSKKELSENERAAKQISDMLMKYRGRNK